MSPTATPSDAAAPPSPSPASRHTAESPIPEGRAVDADDAARQGGDDAKSEDKVEAGTSQDSAEASSDGAAGKEQAEAREKARVEDAPEVDQAQTRAQSQGSEDDDKEAQADAKGKRASSDAPSTAESGEGAAQATHDWQAVWSPPHNAYYFWNSATNTTTWVNPLEPSSAGGSASASAAAAAAAAGPSSQPQADVQPITDSDLASAAGLDPDLAFLDPSLYASQLAAARASEGQYSYAGASAGSAALYASRGTFDRRTGRFRPTAGASSGPWPSAGGGATAGDPTLLKSKRQLSEYFDVDEWEEQRAHEQELEQQQQQGEGKRAKQRHHPSRKELEMFREKKAERKRAKWGWLRS